MDEDLLNILEMAFCRAFQSLPASVLQDHFGALSEPGHDFANVGLNIISPLLQSSRINEQTKLPFVVALSTSQDPEISQWLVSRGSCKPNAKLSLAMSKDLLGPQYLNAFSEAIANIPNPPDRRVFASKDENECAGITTSGMISDLSATWRESLGRPIALTVPFGLPSARIAFVLDYGRIIDEAKDLDQTRNSSLELPWGFREQGFTEKTAMVWTVSLRQYSSMNADEVAELQLPLREELLSESHRQIIQRCAHRVVFLCGPNARRIILSGIRSSIKVHSLELQLSNCRYEAYLELGCALPRLYLYCPELSRTQLGQWISLRRVDMLIRLAVILTETLTVRAGIFERSGMLVQILRQAQAETRGAMKLTTETMDSGLKAWLYRKGITQDSDIKKIEVAAGSLTRGLLMLLHVLPRRDPDSKPYNLSECTAKPARPPRKRSHHQPFDPKQFKEVAHVFEGAKNTRVKEIEDQLLSVEAAKSVVTSKANIPDDEPHNPSAEPFYIRQMEEDLPGQVDYRAFQCLINDNPSWEADSLVESGGVDNSDINDSLTAAFFEGNLGLDDGAHLETSAEASVEFVHMGSHHEVYGGNTPGRRRTATTGVSRASSRIAGETKCKWISGSLAKAEWETKHKTAGYKVRVPDKPHNGGPVVTLCYMQIFFPKWMDFGGKYLTLYPEFVGDGKKHEHLWATLALDTDPAYRLGIRACGTRKDGEKFDMYLERGTTNAVMTANAFADRVLEGLDTIQLESWPRRWVPRKRSSRK